MPTFYPAVEFSSFLSYPDGSFERHLSLDQSSKRRSLMLRVVEYIISEEASDIFSYRIIFLQKTFLMSKKFNRFTTS